MTQEETRTRVSGEFQTTHWSRILTALRSDTSGAQAAWAELYQNYWYPVYAFLRRRGCDQEQAKDLIQELFCRFMQKRALAAVDPARGRFRNFLRACAENLANQQWHRDHALKRGGGCGFVSFDEELAECRYAAEPVDVMSPEKLFDRRWALNLLDRTLEQLKREHAEAGKSAQFEVLHPFLSGAKEAGDSYAEAGARLGLSECAARQAASRMRSRFKELLRMEVAQTVTNATELEEEMRDLRAVLRG